MLGNPFINYDKAIFQSICLRKHLLKDITYFLYVIDDTLILTNVVHEYMLGTWFLVSKILDSIVIRDQNIMELRERQKINLIWVWV